MMSKVSMQESAWNVGFPSRISKNRFRSTHGDKNSSIVPLRGLLRCQSQPLGPPHIWRHLSLLPDHTARGHPSNNAALPRASRSRTRIHDFAFEADFPRNVRVICILPIEATGWSPPGHSLYQWALQASLAWICEPHSMHSANEFCIDR